MVVDFFLGDAFGLVTWNAIPAVVLGCFDAEHLAELTGFLRLWEDIS
jgi:hypothetical protein